MASSLDELVREVASAELAPRGFQRRGRRFLYAVEPERAVAVLEFQKHPLHGSDVEFFVNLYLYFREVQESREHGWPPDLSTVPSGAALWDRRLRDSARAGQPGSDHWSFDLTNERATDHFGRELGAAADELATLADRRHFVAWLQTLDPLSRPPVLEFGPVSEVLALLDVVASE